MIWIVYNTLDTTIIRTSESEPVIVDDESKAQTDYLFIPMQPLYLLSWNGVSVIPNSNENIMKYTGRNYKIYNLVNKTLFDKDFRDINYRTELKSGIKLNGVYQYSDDGFVIHTDLYNNYISPADMGELIVCVSESYTTDPNDISLKPTARRVISKIKTRSWIDLEGNTDSVNTKITNKLYDTFQKQNAEGKRRRENVVNIMSRNVAIGGIFSGAFSSENDANEKLISLMEQYSGGFGSYNKTGQGSLFEDILNDVSNTWLSVTVADTPQTQALVPFMIGLTLRNYIVDKLKGIIK